MKLAALVVALAALACSRPKKEIDGYGLFHLGTSTIADGYACAPSGELTYCSNNPSPPLAGHKTTTDLYFRGAEKSAPLVEILVGVNACRPDDVAADLVETLGEPSESGQTYLLWRQESAIIVARLPVEPGVCEVSFVAPTERARLAELRGEEPTEKASGATGAMDSPPVPH